MYQEIASFKGHMFKTGSNICNFFAPVARRGPWGPHIQLSAAGERPGQH